MYNCCGTFVVKIIDKFAVIFNIAANDLFNGEESLTFKFKKIWFGGSETFGSILLYLGDLVYLHICEDVISFTAPEKINYFSAPIDQNYILYPFARSENHYYMLLDYCIISNEQFDQCGYNPYDLFYTRDIPYDMLEVVAIAAGRN